MVINLTNTGWETDSTVPLTVLGIWTKRNDLVEDLNVGARTRVYPPLCRFRHCIDTATR